MFKKLASMFREDRSQWSDERWRDHLISQARSQSERDEIYAIFSR